jgi:hypothetical protein
MSNGRGSSDEAIGRPQEWREGRYQRNHTTPVETVLTPPGTQPDSHDPVSTPVTRRDYEQPGETPRG